MSNEDRAPEPVHTVRGWRRLASWHVAVPLLALITLLVAWGRDPGVVLVTIAGLLLIGAVLAAVHHAEVVAHRVGEPFGSLLLAVAVTAIEVGLIVTLMVAGGEGVDSLARDTVFAAVMITTNGIVGLAVLVGAIRYGTIRFNAEGSGAALACVTTLATLSMVLPRFTLSEPGPEFSAAQLTFAAAAALLLYVLFVVTQTVRHRAFFLPVAYDDVRPGDDAEYEHPTPPGNRQALGSVGLLMVALVAVVGLAKVESPAIGSAVSAIGFPRSFVGVIIAVLVLLPETIAAVRASLRGHIQTSMNLGYGSAMASIGLTVPVIAVASVWMAGPLVLGLGATQMVLLALTIVVSVLTVVPGRATRLQGGVHLILLAAFLFLAVNP